MSECAYCLSKAEAVWLVVLPVLIVSAWWFLETWMNK